MKTIRFQIKEYEIFAVPVLSDNFDYLACRGGAAVLIDAGDAKPIFQALDENDLQLQKILITHTHHDHTGGCRTIQDRLGVQSVSPGVEAGEFSLLGTCCFSISTPGHMVAHKCYYFPEPGILFTGDTLINGACGRLLGGTPGQLFSSLMRLCELPDETRVFGGHDYLAENMNFALSVEPGNVDMKARLDLYQSDPSAAIFSTLAEEKKTNPFLRVRSVEEFAELRRLKDRF